MPWLLRGEERKRILAEEPCLAGAMRSEESWQVSRADSERSTDVLENFQKWGGEGRGVRW